MDFLLNKRINVINSEHVKAPIAVTPSQDSTDTIGHNSHHFIFGLEDSGIATSHDAHSLEFDDHLPITPPPTIVVEQHLDHASIVLQHPTHGRIIGIEKSKASTSIPSLSINSNATSSLNVHYYPEGNWGWIIVFIAIAAQMLIHGIQLSYGIVLIAAKIFFKNDQMISLGKVNCFLKYSE